jgi:hypothetical protein
MLCAVGVFALGFHEAYKTTRQVLNIIRRYKQDQPDICLFVLKCFCQMSLLTKIK